MYHRQATTLLVIAGIALLWLVIHPDRPRSSIRTQQKKPNVFKRPGARETSSKRKLKANGIAANATNSPFGHSYDTLIFDKIYVVHLPARRDRAKRMQNLSKTLRLNFTWSDAVAGTHPTVTRILSHVLHEREKEGWCRKRSGCSSILTPTPTTSLPLLNGSEDSWHDNSIFSRDAYMSDEVLLRTRTLKKVGADLWEYPATDNNQTLETTTDIPIPVLNTTSMYSILTEKKAGLFTSLAKYNFRQTFLHVNGTHSYNDVSSWWKTLSRAAVACWYSHTVAMRASVTSGAGSALMLEDDVDMEVSELSDG